MKIKRFWADLTVWNKFGVSFVLAVAVLLLLVVVF